jgi:2-polyprenyl-6-methoxyphenol hydroxylase-like FAD-dependent oxidoreductase
MTDILITGAGPTRLTLAIDLLRRGVSIRIVDRARGADRPRRCCAERLAALGGAVEWGVELTAFESGSDAVTAILDGTERLTVAYLVGADGGRSTVRKALAIPFAGETHE